MGILYMSDHYKRIKDRLVRRLEKDTEYVAWMLKKIDKRQEDRPEYGKESEEDREWLEEFAVGNGLDICCGDYAIGDS